MAALCRPDEDREDCRGVRRDGGMVGFDADARPDGMLLFVPHGNSESWVAARPTRRRAGPPRAGDLPWRSCRQAGIHLDAGCTEA